MTRDPLKLVLLGDRGCGKSAFASIVTRSECGADLIDAERPSAGIQFAEMKHGGRRWRILDVGDAERLRPARAAAAVDDLGELQDPLLETNHMLPKGAADAVVVFADASRCRETLRGAEERWLPIAHRALVKRSGTTATFLVVTHVDKCSEDALDMCQMRAEPRALKYGARFLRINAKSKRDCDTLMSHIERDVKTPPANTAQWVDGKVLDL